MWMSESGIDVYLVLGTTDMRKSINGLSFIVSELLEKDLYSGNLFVFCSKSRRIIKVLYWERNGFCIWYKKLDKDHFAWPIDRAEVQQISNRELSWLLSGLKIDQPHAHKKLNYEFAF